MESKKKTVLVTMEIEMLNEVNFNDFEDEWQTGKLIEQAFDQSPWAMQGIVATVKDVLFLS